MGSRHHIARFLCRDEQERQWMLEMHERLLPVTNVGAVICILMALAIVPWTNPLALLPTLFGVGVMGATLATVPRRRDVRPMVGAVAVLQLSIAVAILVNDRAHAGDLFLLVTSIVACAGSFPGRVVTAMAIWSGILMAGAALIADPGAVLATPPTVILPLVTLVVVTLLATAVRRASIEHRRAAVVDALTGTLNRASLTAHSTELAHQTQITGEPVAVVLADVDEFKNVNDLHGHLVGDRVLIDLARLLRELGPAAQAFRLGGDEFALLLPGTTASQAAAIGERIVRDARDARLGGVDVTVSVGVAASSPGSRFSFESVFAEADRALYAAKHDGRDALRVAASDRLAA